MSLNGWEALLDVREPLPDFRELSGVPPGCPEVVGRPPRMSGSGLEALPDVRVVRMPSRMSGSGGEALPNVWEWSGDSPGCP